jgi:tRNA(Ile2) C34 agmatinyltransferase TiaS
MLVLVLPQLGVGAFMLWKGGQEAAATAQAGRQRQLLNIVQTRGQIAISDLVIEMKSSREEVERMLHELVGMGLFSGYVVWDEGMLYSRQAKELRQHDRCLNCNGELALAGKGVIRCPYCGTEYFLD